MALSCKQTRAALVRADRFMIVTYRPTGASYSLDDGRAVTRKAGHELSGQLLLEMPGLPPSGMELTGAEDGLFPGMSQTWRATQ